MQRILFFCLLLTICVALLLTGCSSKTAGSNPTSVPIPDLTSIPPEAESVPPEQSPYPKEDKIEEQLEAMKAFLIGHQEEMEEIVAVMMEYSNSSNYYEYDVRRKILSLCDRNSFRLKEKYTDHPIIDKASILDENLFYYVFVQYENPLVDIDACCFTVFICDENGIAYCRIWLFYCEGEPIEKEFYPIFPVIPHWYLFVEYLE